MLISAVIRQTDVAVRYCVRLNQRWSVISVLGSDVMNLDLKVSRECEHYFLFYIRWLRAMSTF